MVVIVLLVFMTLIFIAVQQTKQSETNVGKARKALSTIPNFRPGPTGGTALNKLSISIDPSGQRFAIVSIDQSPKVYKFDQLVAVEVERDGRSITKTNRGGQVAGAAVGAVLLGPAGLLLGGLTGSKRTEEKIKRIALKLYTNDLRSPIIEVPFLSGWTEHNPDSFIVKTAARQADEWYGRFLAILQTRTSTQ